MNNMRWDLSDLYSSYDSNEYRNDFNSLKELINEYNKTFNEIDLSVDTKSILEKYIDLDIKLSNLFRKLGAYSSLQASVDASNEKAQAELDKISSLASDLALPETKIKAYIKNITNLDEVINSSEILKIHEFYLKEAYKNAKYILSDREEVLLAKLKQTGSSAWSNLQNKITATFLVDIAVNGEMKELPLPTVRNMAYSPDKNVRRLAYEAELASYKKIEESSAAALNGIKGEVISVTEQRGFKSPLDETLFDSRMTRDTLESMLMAMEEYLPKFHEYFNAKAKYLGYENGKLPFYDMFAPIGKSNMLYTYDEARDYIVKNFNTFSKELGDFAQTAFDDNWIDAEQRPGKRGGAFCSNIHPIGQSRVMSNFDGSFSNVITLAHELGHAFHGHNLKDESILNSSYPMPIAETASIFCETIVTNAAIEEASKDEQLSILEASISDAAQVIVDIYSRYLFETEFFKRRKSHSLPVDEIKDIMIEAQTKAYGSGLDENLLHPYMWINKTHYYSAGRNFYNFPYAFGLLFSKGLYANYLEDKEAFIPKYNDLLKVTGKNSIEEVALIADIDITKPDFFRNSLKLIEKDIDKFVSLL